MLDALAHYPYYHIYPDPQQTDLRATIANLPVAMANLFVPDPRLAGTVNGDVRVTGATAAPNIDGEIRATGLRADAPYATGLPPANLTVNAKMRESGMVSKQASMSGWMITSARSW